MTAVLVKSVTLGIPGISASVVLAKSLTIGNAVSSAGVTLVKSITLGAIPISTGPQVWVLINSNWQRVYINIIGTVEPGQYSDTYSDTY